MLGLLGSLLGSVGSIFGADRTAQAQEQTARNNMLMQQEFAQSGVQWRARDASEAEKNTGINRLTLLGAPTASFSNVVGASDAGAGVSAAGQQIGRAIGALADKTTRLDQLNEQLVEAKIANINSDTVKNQAAASKMAVVAQPGSGPGIPLPIEAPWKVGRIPLYQEAYDREGNIHIIPSEKAASPLQTLGAMPINLGMAADIAAKEVLGRTEPSLGVRGDVARWGQNWDPFVWNQ